MREKIDAISKTDFEDFETHHTGGNGDVDNIAELVTEEASGQWGC